MASMSAFFTLCTDYPTFATLLARDRLLDHLVDFFAALQFTAPLEILKNVIYSEKSSWICILENDTTI